MSPQSTSETLERREIATQGELAPIPVEVLIQKIVDSGITPQSVEVIERLVALMESQRAQQRKERFDEALRKVQGLVGRVAKNGLMDRGPGKGQIPYSKREDVDAMVRPIYLEAGFSVDWDAPLMADGGKIRIVGRFHCAGHTETREISIAPDPSGGKTGPQSIGSAVAYGQRYLEKMFWNIIDEGADTDGAPKPAELITQNQADDIRTRMNDLPQSAPGKLLAVLCRKYGVERPEEITTAQYDDAARTVADSERLATQKATRK